ncbi:hypothetical protein ACA910_019375 [Epithemia clementina (nom. ined.)]
MTTVEANRGSKTSERPLEAVKEDSQAERSALKESMVKDNKKSAGAATEPESHHSPTEDASDADPILETDSAERAGPTPTAADPFPVTDTNKVLLVPLASEWHDGLIIRDHGTLVAKVLCEERMGRLKSGNPVFRVSFSDENDQIMAVVTRKLDTNGQDSYEISSVYPTYPDQQSEPYVYMHKDPKDHNIQKVVTTQVYPYVKLVQSTLGGVHTVKSCQDDKIVIMKAKNRDIKFMVICCPVALIRSPYFWTFAFHRGRPTREPAILRDQESQQLHVKAGESMLLAVCVSYAVDRMTSTMCM